MAVKRFCDRCSDEIKPAYSWYEFGYYENRQSTPSYNMPIEPEGKVEMCKRCKYEYDKWFKDGGIKLEASTS